MPVANGAEAPGSFSEATVVGRRGARVDQRVLPSGDTVTIFTVVVDRTAKGRGSSGVQVDSIACQTFRTTVARRLDSLAEGDWIRVDGALRRRFWRSGAGLGSAMEVDVRRLERVRMRT
jgi:single-strand DNA-binding protein